MKEVPDSREELSQFVRQLPGSSQGASGFHFDALVVYEAAWHPKVEKVTRVWTILATYDDGVVHLNPVDGLTSDTHHMEFRPDFQFYAFDSDSRSLIITGKSGRFGGDYRVEISPR